MITITLCETFALNSKIDEGVFRLAESSQRRRDGTSSAARTRRANPQALSVVAMHAIPQGLAIHAAGLRRRPAIRTVEHHCKSQHPPRRRTILLSAGRRTKVLSCQ